MKTKIEGVYEDFINVSTWTPGDCRGLITSYRVHGIGLDVNGKQIQVGDKVKVLFGGEELDWNFFWHEVWNSKMDNSIGKVFEVLRVLDDNGVKLKDNEIHYWYPWFCLEVVEQAKSTQDQPEQQGEGVGTMSEENSTEGLKSPGTNPEKRWSTTSITARWHSEIAKMYYEDSSLVCQAEYGGVWKNVTGPEFHENNTYRLIREVESFKYVMYNSKENYSEVVFTNEGKLMLESLGYKLVHTDFQHQTEVVLISEAKK